jgi:hypothetical protein
MSKDICASAKVPQDHRDPRDTSHRDTNDLDRYRSFAQSCLNLALRATDPPMRAMFLAMAQAWNSLADRNLNATTQTALEDFNQRQLDG